MKKRSTFAVNFIAQKNKLKKNGRVPILGSITINTERVYFSTKLDVPPERWGVGRTLGMTRDEKEINNIIDTYAAIIRAEYNDRILSGQPVTAARLKAAILHLDDSSSELLKICDGFIADYRKLVDARQVTQDSYQRYVLTRERLEKYIKAKYNLPDISISEINYDFINGFDLWNRTEHKCNNNTTIGIVKHFRTMFNVALYNGWIKSDPFVKYKPKFTKVNRGYLTQEELDSIIKTPLENPKLDLARDMFLFSVFTGLAFTDVHNLTYRNIERREDGKQWISTYRKKTNNFVQVMLLDVPLKIMEKYDGRSKKGYLLPMPCNQIINNQLKEVAIQCGIKKHLTYHMSRHTFATTVTLSNGVPIETVQKLLGHSSIKTTQIYARVISEKIAHDMNVLEAKLNSIPTLSWASQRQNA